MNANEKPQVGGGHYREEGSIQPWEVIDTWSFEARIGFYRGNALKYMMRYDKKGGIEDLQKAQHYTEKLIEVLNEQKVHLASLTQPKAPGAWKPFDRYLNERVTATGIGVLRNIVGAQAKDEITYTFTEELRDLWVHAVMSAFRDALSSRPVKLLFEDEKFMLIHVPRIAADPVDAPPVPFKLESAREVHRRMAEEVGAPVEKLTDAPGSEAHAAFLKANPQWQYEGVLAREHFHPDADLDTKPCDS